MKTSLLLVSNWSVGLLYSIYKRRPVYIMRWKWSFSTSSNSFYNSYSHISKFYITRLKIELVKWYKSYLHMISRLRNTKRYFTSNILSWHTFAKSIDNLIDISAINYATINIVSTFLKGSGAYNQGKYIPSYNVPAAAIRHKLLILQKCYFCKC